jgi:hypothetical protein
MIRRFLAGLFRPRAPVVVPAPVPVPVPSVDFDTLPGLPRGIRNKNPGNIRHGDKWQGLSAEQPDADFCRFDSHLMGLRALMRVLIAYRKRHGLDTTAEIIGRWAPPVENDTGAYVRQVAQRLGVGPDDEVNVLQRATLVGLARAIVRHENGRPPAGVPIPPDWYDADTYDRAADLALATEA